MQPLDEALAVRALKNVERTYDMVWYGEKMKAEATAWLTGEMRRMYKHMPDFVEIQVFGDVPSPKESAVPIEDLAKMLPKAPVKKR